MKIFTLIIGLITLPALAQLAKNEDYSQWPILDSTLGSTSGNGSMIRGYVPRVEGKICTTNFSTTEQDGRISYNTVEFEAVETQGGVLCQNGRWRSLDGSVSGTTPLRAFIKGDVIRRSS